MPATGDFAFSAWVKPASNSGAQYVMGTVNANNPEGVGLLLSGDGTVALFDKITTTTFISTLTAPPNQWTFIVAGRKQGIGYIYVNTLPNPTCDHCIQEAMSGYSNFSIGNDPDFTYPPFDGQIDEVRVFNSFPSEDEIYSLYQDSMVSYDSSPPTRYPLAPSDFGLGGQD
jgi:hypothetical protein